MAHEIIRPNEQEALDIVIHGGAICNDCGAIMFKTVADGEEIFVCPDCESVELVEDYEFTRSYDEVEDDEIPEGCLTCGGPYPNCMISCELYDD